VKVYVPEVDRGCTDHCNILGVVIKKNHDLYQVGTKYGMLEHFYSRNQLEPCKESFLQLHDVKRSMSPAPLISNFGLKFSGSLVLG